MLDNKFAKGLTGADSGGGTENEEQRNHSFNKENADDGCIPVAFCAPLSKSDKIFGVIGKGMAGLLIVCKPSAGLMAGGAMLGV